MNAEFICVPVSTGAFLSLSAFLKRVGSAEPPTRAIEMAIAYWLDNAEWKADDLLPSNQTQRGYSWKELFLPEGTQLRMRYKGKVYSASVTGDNIIYDARAVSPSEFANSVAGSARNAWRDVEVLFPGAEAWVLADKLRE